MALEVLEMLLSTVCTKYIAVPSGGMLRVNKLDLALLGTATCRTAATWSALQQLPRTDLDAVAAKRGEGYRWLGNRSACARWSDRSSPNARRTVPHDFPVPYHDGWREKLYFASTAEDLPTIALDHLG